MTAPHFKVGDRVVYDPDAEINKTNPLPLPENATLDRVLTVTHVSDVHGIKLAESGTFHYWEPSRFKHAPSSTSSEGDDGQVRVMDGEGNARWQDGPASVDDDQPYVVKASKVTEGHEVLHAGDWRSVQAVAPVHAGTIAVHFRDCAIRLREYFPSDQVCVRNRKDPQPSPVEVNTLREMLTHWWLEVPVNDSNTGSTQTVAEGDVEDLQVLFSQFIKSKEGEIAEKLIDEGIDSALSALATTREITALLTNNHSEEEEGGEG